MKMVALKTKIAVVSVPRRNSQSLNAVVSGCVCLDPGTGPTKVEPVGHSHSDKRRQDEGDIETKSEQDSGSAKKQKVTMSFSRTTTGLKSAEEKKAAVAAPISIKLGSQKTKEPTPALQMTSSSVAEAFNLSSDEEEEMPPEARMRMRNIGRETPTSAGPNSFGKTRQGFCDVKKVFERQLKTKIEKLPQ